MLTGERLRLLRQARQIKQKEMARIMGISQQRYSMLEKSKKISDWQSGKILTVLKFTTADVENIFNILPPRNK